MLGGAARKLRKFEDDLRAWHTDAERSRRKELLDRIRVADKASIDLEAGPSKFYQVSLRQRMADRFAALFDSATRVHTHCDPIEAYKKRMQARVTANTVRAKGGPRLRRILEAPDESAEVNMDQLLRREDGSEIPVADRLRAQIGYKQAYMNQIEAERIPKIKALDDLLDSLGEEAKGAQAEYDAWYRTLGRPAYFEVLRVRAAPLSGAAQSSKEDSAVSNVVDANDQAQAKSWWKKLLAIGKIGAAPVILPLEAGYAYAAFELVTPGQVGPAVAAAAIFTLALAGTGALAANFGLRAFRHRVTASSKVSTDASEGEVIRTFINRRMLAATIVSVLVGLLLIIGGADLRSKLPQESTWRKEQMRLNDERQQLISAPFQGSTIGDDGRDFGGMTSKEKSDDVNRRIIEHDRSRQDILRFDWRIQQSDEFVALGVYLALFIFGAGIYVIARDPYNEYAIVANYLQSVTDLRRSASISREIFEERLESRKEIIKTSILDLRSRLWLLNKDDKLGPNPYEKNASNSQVRSDASEQSSGSTSSPDNRSTTDRVNTAAEQAQERKASKPVEESERGPRVAEIWVADRLARYAQWYVLIFGRAAASLYPQSIKKALERSV